MLHDTQKNQNQFKFSAYHAAISVFCVVLWVIFTSMHTKLKCRHKSLDVIRPQGVTRRLRDAAQTVEPTVVSLGVHTHMVQQQQQQQRADNGEISIFRAVLRCCVLCVGVRGLRHTHTGRMMRGNTKNGYLLHYLPSAASAALCEHPN